jgi:cold shock CspA family protein/ribosome-associated translation inhibitor RaiA
MKFPIRIQFRDMEKSAKAYNDIWDHADKLERIYDRIISCEVIVSAPHHRKQLGTIYHVQVRLHVPGKNIFVANEPEESGAHEDLHVAIRDAFDSTRRQLEDLLDRERGMIKVHNSLPHGKVVRLFPHDRYGFIRTRDDRDIYFHANAVLHNDFDHLQIGDEVRFAEELGNDGAQVTSMALVKPVRLPEEAVVS